MTGYFYIVKA